MQTDERDDVAVSRYVYWLAKDLRAQVFVAGDQIVVTVTFKHEAVKVWDRPAGEA